jgi:hypothetical protein
MRSPIWVDGVKKYRGWNMPADSRLFQAGASILYSLHRDKFCVGLVLKNSVSAEMGDVM